MDIKKNKNKNKNEKVKSNNLLNRDFDKVNLNNSLKEKTEGSKDDFIEILGRNCKTYCEICGADSKKLGRLQYNETICVKLGCNEKGLHSHYVCIKCCDKIKIKKSTFKLESNKNNQTGKSNQIFLNKMSEEPKSFDEKSFNLLARRIERNNNLKKIKERSKRINSSK